MRRLTLPTLTFLIGLAASATATEISVEGSFSDVTVVARDAPRSEVIERLLSTFDIEMAGEEIAERRIDGRYQGTLSRILHQIAPDVGFVIAHANGKPRRVVFSGQRRQDATGAVPDTVASQAELDAIMTAPPPIEMRAPEPGPGAPEEELPRRPAADEAAPSPTPN